MNEHDATEQAFKNGYKKAAEEIFAEIDRFCMENKIEDATDEQIYSWYKNLKKKYKEGET